MTLSLDLGSLRSRKVDALIKSKRVGANAIKKLPGQFLEKVKRFAGWAFSGLVSYFRLNFSNLWDLVVQGYFALKYFDWNSTDSQLEKMVERNNQQMVTYAAQALGTTLGWNTVRLANHWIGKIGGDKSKAYAQSTKTPVLAARVGLALAEEGNEETAMAVRSFLTQSMSLQIANGFVATLLTARKNHWFGLNSITEPQTNGSIAQKIEDQIEKLPAFWQNPVEELIESFEEAIIEAGYVISYTIDDHVSAMRYAQRNTEKQRVITIKPEKGSDEELKFYGSQSQVMDTVATTVQGVYPLIRNRDVGEIFAEPVDEQVKLKNQLRKLVLSYSEYERPPFRRNGRLGRRAEISIPDCKVVSWSALKSILPKFTTGEYFVSVELDNGRQMQGWFSSPSEGESTLTTLSTLSTADILPETFRHSKGKKAHQGVNRMFINHASILYPKRKDGKNSGIKGKPKKISLWKDSEDPIPDDIW